jgi:hypothetical protein
LYSVMSRHWRSLGERLHTRFPLSIEKAKADVLEADSDLWLQLNAAHILRNERY